MVLCSEIKDITECNKTTKCNWDKKAKRCKTKNLKFKNEEEIQQIRYFQNYLQSENTTKNSSENTTTNSKEFSELKKSINKKIKQSLGGKFDIFNLKTVCGFAENNNNKYCAIYNYFSDETEEKKGFKKIVDQVNNLSLEIIPEIKSNLKQLEGDEQKYKEYLNSTMLKVYPSNNKKIIELINNYKPLKNEGVALFLKLKSEIELIQIKNKKIVFI